MREQVEANPRFPATISTEAQLAFTDPLLRYPMGISGWPILVRPTACTGLAVVQPMMVLIVCRHIVCIFVASSQVFHEPVQNMTSVKWQFGTRVRRLRAARNLSQEELASRAGVHRTYLGGIERGERNPSLKNIAALAQALGVTLSQMFRFED